MNISKDDIYAVIGYTWSIFGVAFDPAEIPEDLVEKMLINSRDFSLTEEIAVIISSHNRIEQSLEVFLRGVAPQPKYIKQVAPNYAKKIDLCLLLGLDSQYEKPLKAFGRFRNRFAHESDAALELIAVDALRESLPENEQNFIEFLDEFFDRVREADSSMSVAKKFRDLSGVDQYRLMSMALWLSLYVYTGQFIESRSQKSLSKLPVA